MEKIQYILFDLDDTLYTNASGLFAEVGQRIELWVSRTLGVSMSEAKKLRRHYYRTFGTTMAGLYREHPEVEIDDYLDYVHAIDVTRYLSPDPLLDAMLATFETPKAVFTNSISDWAERVTARLGIRHHFTHIIDVRAVEYKCKPDLHAYARATDILNVAPQACVMLDDQPSYLHGAATAGMCTILVRANGRPGEGIDFAVNRVHEAGPLLKTLLA